MTTTAKQLKKIFQNIINIGERNQFDKLFKIQDIILENKRK